MTKKLIYTALLFSTLAFLCFCHMKNRPIDNTSDSIAPSIAADHIDPSEKSKLKRPLYATGACLMDAKTERILYGKDENKQLPMASTTKIMTCLLALEKGNLNDTVTFSPNAAKMPKVHLGASSGKKFILKDLLYSLMLESHNDTAVAIAEHLGGSVEGFAKLMNARANELGMTSTNFVTPNGLDSPDHHSTPADMCRLASFACSKNDFLEIIQTPSKTIQDIEGKTTYSLTNHDAFLSSYEGAIGVKTGFTGKAGYCFVGAAKRDDRTLISCVLGSGWPPNKSYKWADTKELMNYGFDKFTYQNLSIKDLSKIKISVHNGKADYVNLKQPEIPSYLLGPSDTVDITYKTEASLAAPVKEDIAVGSVIVSINNTPVGTFSLYPKKAVEKKELPDLLYYIFDLFFLF